MDATERLPYRIQVSTKRLFFLKVPVYFKRLSLVLPSINDMLYLIYLYLRFA